MEEKLKELMQELGNAINESLSDSDRIAAAIGEIKRASIDDGKNLEDHPPIDARMRPDGRFRKALELLDKAHNDTARAEDVPQARGMRDRAIHHIDQAHGTVDDAIRRTHTSFSLDTASLLALY